jgi:hypothetical protein
MTRLRKLRSFVIGLLYISRPFARNPAWPAGCASVRNVLLTVVGTALFCGFSAASTSAAKGFLRMLFCTAEMPGLARLDLRPT